MPAPHSRAQLARRFGTARAAALAIAFIFLACFLGVAAARHASTPETKAQNVPSQIVDEAHMEHAANDPILAQNEAGQDAPKPETQPSPTPAASAKASAKEREVKAFVDRYFKVWSDQDMDAYDDCFMTDASIQYIDQRGQLFTTPRQRFVASQRDIHRRSTTRSIEVPVTTEIRFEQEYARAVVYWKLTSGNRIQMGYDHFTLKQDRGQWRIVNLLFYSTSDTAGD